MEIFRECDLFTFPFCCKICVCLPFYRSMHLLYYQESKSVNKLLVFPFLVSSFFELQLAVVGLSLCNALNYFISFELISWFFR